MSERIHSHLSRLALLALLLLTSGCTHLGEWAHNGFKVGPNYRRPAAPVADNWIDFNDPRVISSAQGVDDALWWRQLGDPTIDHLVQTAYRQNLPLREAGLRVLEARSLRGIAAGNLLPQFQEYFGQYQRIQNPDTLPGPGGGTFDYWANGFNASWELDIWGKLRRSIESA